MPNPFIGITNTPTPAPSNPFLGISNPFKETSSVPQTKIQPPSYFMGGGYGMSQSTDPFSGRPLMMAPLKIPQTFNTPEQTISQISPERVAVSFDPTKPQKLTPDQLKNGRLPESASQAIRKQLGNNFAELDHIMPLELGGSNTMANLRGGGVDTKFENELTRKALSGEISVADAWLQMADYKGIKIPESKPGMIEKIRNEALKVNPQLLEPLAKLQEDPLGIKGDFSRAGFEANKSFIDTIVNSVGQAGQDVADWWATKTSKTARPGEVAGAGLKMIAGVGGALFSPISALFAATEKLPVIKSLSTFLSYPWTLVGEGGRVAVDRILDRGALSKLPQDVKDNIRQGAEEVGSLTAQILLGKVVDVIGKKTFPSEKSATSFRNDFVKDNPSMVEDVNKIPTNKINDIVKNHGTEGAKAVIKQSIETAQGIKSGKLAPEVIKPKIDEAISKTGVPKTEIPKELNHPEIGKIEIYKGDKGFGMTKIKNEHPDVIPYLKDAMENAKVIEKLPQRTILESQVNGRIIRMVVDHQLGTAEGITPKTFLNNAYFLDSVPREGIEPPTPSASGKRSANELPRPNDIIPQSVGETRGITPKSAIDEFAEKTKPPEISPIKVPDVELKPKDAELTSGVNPHLDKFIEQDIKPTIKTVLGGVKKTFDTLKELFTPAKKSEVAIKTSSILRENLGKMARTRELLYTKLLESRKIFDRYTPEQATGFMDKIERGQPIEGANEFVGVIRDALDSRWKKIQEIKGTDAYIENYFPHIWKDPAKASETLFKYFGKKPFEGTKSFLKQRTIPTIKEGIELGLEPVSYNPVDLVMAKIADMDKFLMAQDTIKSFKDEGLMKFVKFGDKPPVDWIQINDKVGKVYQYSEEAKGMVARGNYYMPRDGARIINNYLSPGLQGNPIYQAIRKSGNFMTQLNLGFSAFHALFTTNDAVISKIALGLQKLSRMDIAGGFKDFAESPTYILKNVIHGNKLLNDYFRDNPEMPQLVDALERSGGRVKMDSFYQNTATEGFMKALRSENYLGALIRTPGALVESVSKPILQWLVPRQKLGVFMDLAKDIMAQSEKGNWSQAKETLRLQEAWDSVDNRLGELVYDNLFWNKALKDLGMASVRAVGWNLGTIRELGGGLKEIGSVPYKLATGGEIRMTPRMAYTMTLPIVVGLEGAVLMKLFTGNWPTQLLDYYYPKTGKQNADGSDERIALPSYMKDVAAVYGEGPVKVATNKLNPVFATISDMFQNQDYYGTEIRNSNDPMMKQLTDEFTFLAKQFTPFSVQGTIKGQSTLAKYGSFVGLTPAPSYIRKTSLEKKIEGIYTTRFGGGTRTQEDTQTQQIKAEIRKAYIAGDKETANKLLEEAKKNGVFANQSAVNKFISDSDIPTSVRLFRRLSSSDQQGLLKQMNLAELNQFAWEASKYVKANLSSLSDNAKQFVEMVKSGEIKQPIWKQGKITNE